MTEPITGGTTDDGAGGGWDDAPALLSPELAPIRASSGLFIDGALREPRAGGSIACHGPRDGRVLCQVAVADDDDVDRAVQAAHRAQPAWAARPGRERGRVLLALAELLEREQEALAVLETLDSGRPIRHTLEVDVPACADHLVHHAGWADKLAWAGLGDRPTARGVVAQLASSRAPLVSVVRDLAPALACGNSLIVKPAGCTPLGALHLAELAQEAGLPPGVLAVLTGPAGTGEALVAHPGLDAVTIRGPAAALRHVRRQLAGRRTRLGHADAGGDVALVFDDAPMDEAVDGVVRAAFCNQGPTSWSTARLLIQENVHDHVLAGVQARLERCRLGDPLDRNTDLGPLAASAHRDALTSLVNGASRVMSSGHHPPDEGWWFAPTIVDAEVDPLHVAAVCDRGPAVGLQSFRTAAEAVAKADDAWLGGTVTIWSSTGSRSQAVAERVRARSVWVNSTPRTGPPDRGSGLWSGGTDAAHTVYLRATRETRLGR